jgi:hypothetical protein
VSGYIRSTETAIDKLCVNVSLCYTSSITIPNPPCHLTTVNEPVETIVSPSIPFSGDRHPILDCDTLSNRLRNDNLHLKPSQSRSPEPLSTTNHPITVDGVPSVKTQERLVVGDSQCLHQNLRRSRFTNSLPGFLRSYTVLKVLGSGSFSTVWLCDWHGILPLNTPLPAMQYGEGARPEWAGKRLVAIKRMRKKWDGGWDDCKHLKELQASCQSALQFSPYAFFLRHCTQFPTTPISLPYTIHFLSWQQKSYTLFSNPWRAIYITS